MHIEVAKTNSLAAVPFVVGLQFGPLEETYAILTKFEVSATEEEQKMLTDLEQAGEDFKDMLKEVEQVRRISEIILSILLKPQLTYDLLRSVYQVLDCP